MKLLLDQNLSRKLVTLLADVYPGAAHVTDHGLERADDSVIWQFARNHGYMIVSKDDDFHQRSFVYGAPPKVVFVRLGNCTTARIERILRDHLEDLRAFDANPDAAFLVLS